MITGISNFFSFLRTSSERLIHGLTARIRQWAASFFGNQPSSTPASVHPIDRQAIPPSSGQNLPVFTPSLTPFSTPPISSASTSSLLPHDRGEEDLAELQEGSLEEAEGNQILDLDFAASLPTMSPEQINQAKSEDKAFLSEKISSYCSDWALHPEKKLIELAYGEIAINQPLKIVLASQILQDGLGDYFSQLSAAKELKAILPPGSEIRLIVQPESSLPDVDLAEYGLTESEVIYLPTQSDMGEYKADTAQAIFSYYLSNPERRSAELKERIQNESFYKSCPALLKFCSQAHTALFIPMRMGNGGLLFHNYLNKHHVPLFHISEYGIKYGELFGPEREKAMGLNADNTGIYIPSIQVAETFDHSELETLFAKSTNPPFFCYMKDPFPFLQQALKESDSSKDVCVITKLPGNKRNRAELIKSQLDLTGVSRVSMIKLTKKGPKETILYENSDVSQGKVLSCIDPFPLSHADFLKCIAHSQSLVGCTGDMSFSEVLALGKIPFYEIRDHKQNFWRSLENMAEHYEKNKVAEWVKHLRVLKQGQETTCEVTEELNQEMQELLGIMKRHHNMQPFLKCMVQRNFLHKKFPKLEAFEAKLLQAHREGKMTLSQLHTHLTATLQQLANPAQVS